MRILISGANRGLGLAFVQHYLSSGATVYAACRRPGQATALNRLAGDYPTHLKVLPLDVGKPASIAALRSELALLTDRLDRLINNAGILASNERFGHLEPDTMARSYAINAIGPVLLTQACADLLEAGDSPRIGNISSGLSSISGVSGFHSPSYNASKAALNMWTRLLAHALNPRGILCFALRPGWVRTDMGGEKATLSPDESVAGMIEVLENATADDQATLLGYDGGRTAW